ncbi:MAG TPA: cytochrome P460 [Thiomicrospira sp.]|nr:cytochrome P460 [Thiomicrospira sp.]
MQRSLSKLRTIIYLSTFSLLSTAPTYANSADIPPPTANGIEFPVNYQDWGVVAVSHREDNKTLRAIIGNPKAIKAIEENKTNPWPDGAALGKMVWKDRQDDHWKAATVPAKFIHAEFMFKDAEKWQDTGGWGWARWLGTEQKPFGNTVKAAQSSCIACHTPVKNQDWVFTKPAIMPKRIK